MRAAVIAVLLAAAAPAAAGAPLALAERQVLSLEFQQPVARVAITDPDLLQVQVSGARVTVTALRGGRASLEVAFPDASTVGYDVVVEGARRPAAPAPATLAPADELALAVGQERRFRAAGVARVLVEENGVARVAVVGELVTVTALAAGQSSLVLVDAAGGKTTWLIRVR